MITHTKARTKITTQKQKNFSQFDKKNFFSQKKQTTHTKQNTTFDSQTNLCEKKKTKKE